MLYIVTRAIKLIFNTAVLIACIGFFLLVYIVIWVSEAGSNKPKLAVR